MEVSQIAAAQDALAAREAERSGKAPGPSLGAASALGQEDFLAMLIAQLENQDPLDPQDATEFTSQLATFSSLDQLVGMRSALDRVADVTNSSQRLSTASLVGKRVLGESSQVRIGAEDSVRPEISVDLERPVEKMIVELVDHFGRVRASTELKTPAAGRHELQWSDFDREVGPGDYDIRISAGLEGLDGTQALVRDTVTGASFASNTPSVLLGGIEIPFASVREISQQ